MILFKGSFQFLEAMHVMSIMSSNVAKIGEGLKS